jgi:type VI secretion system secreted protein VgrG
MDGTDMDKKRALSALVGIALLVAIGAMGTPSANAAHLPTVGLGTAASFAVLAGSGITNTGPSVINGDIGSFPTTSISGFPPGIVNGTDHGGDGVTQGAKGDLTTAYNDAAGRTPVTTVPTELGGTTLTHGVYSSAAGTFGITGALTLDAQGDASAVFIFQMASTLTTATASSVVLIGGAQACNVFWQVGSSATIGGSTDFQGNILALTSITLVTSATVDGRVLARNGAVTLDTNTITTATCAAVPTPTPTATATATPSATVAPTATPAAPTATPAAPTATPVAAPTVAPTVAPAATPIPVGNIPGAAIPKLPSTSTD